MRMPAAGSRPIGTSQNGRFVRTPSPSTCGQLTSAACTIGVAGTGGGAGRAPAWSAPAAPGFGERASDGAAARRPQRPTRERRAGRTGPRVASSVDDAGQAGCLGRPASCRCRAGGCSSRNSMRVRALSRKTPSIALVTANRVLLLARRASTCRGACASHTTATPSGSMLRRTVSAIWLVMRSWICSRRANTSTSRGILLSPMTCAARDVGDVALAEERQQVVLAEAVEVDVLHDDHLAVVHREERIVEDCRSMLACVSAGEESAAPSRLAAASARAPRDPGLHPAPPGAAG